MSSVSYRTFTGTGAQNYERYFVPAIAIPVSAELLRAADLQPGLRILDVACGTGVIARLAAEKIGSNGSVTGVDLSPDMIAVARATPWPAGVPVEWHVGEATSLPVADGSYDVVLCQMGLMFMEDKARALGEMHRVLVPGGRLVVSTPGNIQPAFEIMEQALVDHISPKLGGFVRAVFSMHDPDVVAELLRGAGFNHVSATTTSATLQLPAPAEFLWQYINLTPMAPLVAEASEEARSALERQVVSGWQPYVSDGRTPVEQPMVIAAGRK